LKKIILIILSLYFVLNVNAQGDFCGTAFVLPGSGTYNANGPATGGGCFNCTNATNADWYVFTPPSNGFIDIATCMGGTDTRFWVYDGSCGTLNQIAAADDECDMGTGNLWASEALAIPVTGGTSYYIEFDDRWSPNGFTWNFTYSTSPCGPAPLPYSENFDGVAPNLPPCWTTLNPNDVMTTGTCTGSTNESLQVNGVAGAYAYSRIIDASGQSAVSVSFDYRGGDNVDCTNDPEAGDNLNVDYWNGNSWINIVNYDGAGDPNVFTPQSHIITSGLTNSFQLRFQNQFGSGAGFDNYNFDNLVVQAAVGCPSPSNLTATNITFNSAYLGWTENGTATLWEVEWDTAGYTPGTSINSAITGANPLILSTLQPITSYDFYVRAICGPLDTSLWGGPHNFMTLNVGVNEFADKINLNIYPNPSNGNFIISFNPQIPEDYTIKLLNAKGQEILYRTINKKQGEIKEDVDIRAFSKGIYLLQISSSNGITTKRIIHQ
jgi:hypothetical protein